MDTYFKLKRFRHMPTSVGSLISNSGDITRSLTDRLIEYVELDKDVGTGIIEPKKTTYLQMDTFGGKLFIDEYSKYFNNERRYLNSIGLKHLVDDLFIEDKTRIFQDMNDDN